MENPPKPRWYRARAPKDLGRAIKSIRRAATVTQFQLADETTISRSTIQRLEQGADVSLATAITVLGELGYELIVVPRGAELGVG
ncbi:helix-turn-helix domain-containing protein [Homoserinibacter sp. GY 40078]|uniref:helix-turn-helix domain-containing protein n=1 Tax=Homoserinibacter sp. GY 40078 TaxID=2603275 RepID=UPI00165014D6|nr:helix-turn-helix transcriptional regulator [Homoserinibacter sp. GY 40078]